MRKTSPPVSIALGVRHGELCSRSNGPIMLLFEYRVGETVSLFLGESQGSSCICKGHGPTFYTVNVPDVIFGHF